jgi:hypothetical protein
VGLVSEKGLVQTRGLDKAFRTRYKQWLQLDKPNGEAKKPLVKVWADSAGRCSRSATVFEEGLSGNSCHAYGQISAIANIDQGRSTRHHQNPTMDSLNWTLGPKLFIANLVVEVVTTSAGI